MSAEDYAREILGMADDEPNGATGFEMAQAFLDMTTAFEAGRREGAETMRDAAAVKADRQQYEGKLTPFDAADMQADARARAIAASIRALPVEVTE